MTDTLPLSTPPSEGAQFIANVLGIPVEVIQAAANVGGYDIVKLEEIGHVNDAGYAYVYDHTEWWPRERYSSLPIYRIVGQDLEE